MRLNPNPADGPPEVNQAVAYLWQKRRRMNKATHRKASLPIGTDTVESAANTLIHQRIKQDGMRWSRDGAQTMLAPRALLLSTAGTKSLFDHFRPYSEIHTYNQAL